jgi:hypothetical protein
MVVKNISDGMLAEFRSVAAAEHYATLTWSKVSVWDPGSPAGRCP